MIPARPISTADTYLLRLSVLRPGRTLEDVRFKGDELPTTTHLGAFSPDGRLRAIASLYAAPHPHTGKSGWQLRGMASDPAVRGQGYGRAVLRACIEYVRAQATKTRAEALLWCNARTGAVGFYQGYDFVVEGGEFEVPDVGPHCVMSLRIGPLGS